MMTFAYATQGMSQELEFGTAWTSIFSAVAEVQFDQLNVSESPRATDAIKKIASEFKAQRVSISIIVGPGVLESEKPVKGFSAQKINGHTALVMMAKACNTTLTYERFGVVFGGELQPAVIATIVLKERVFPAAKIRSEVLPYGPMQQLAIAKDGKTVTVLGSQEIASNFVAIIRMLGLVDSYSLRETHWPMRGK